MRAGLWDESGRCRLVGVDDGERRYRLGTLRLNGRGGDVTGGTWTPVKPEADPTLARMNVEGREVDFGAVATDGALRLTREGDAVLVTPLPGSARFDVRIAWGELPWRLPEPRSVEAISETGEVLSRGPVGRRGHEVAVTCEPGVFAYRLAR
ncbi:MAG: hypothetical protein ACYS9X_18185 [Planctomycetota bacterium]|jgi:hypothetical protein